MPSAVERYRTTQATTASRERLFVLLLEKALRCIREGAEALETGRRADSVAPLTRASDIVVELLSTLDPARAPELTAQLGAVYQFVCARLTRAVLGEVRAARDAERALEPLVDGFSRAVASLEAR